MTQALVVTGMHRSGTSMVSSLLQGAGVDVGARLLPGNAANPRGYFEDMDFYEYHEGLLHRRGMTYLHFDSEFVFRPTGPETAAARSLVAARAGLRAWAWTDPRTCLFLDFWADQLPRAKFLFVFRHPIDVAVSLLRRGEFDASGQPRLGLLAWKEYNRRVEDFCLRRPDRALLVHVDGLAADPHRFAVLAEKKFRLRLRAVAERFPEVYHGEDLRRPSADRAYTMLLRGLDPTMMALYDRLDAMAALPSTPFSPTQATNRRLDELVTLVARCAYVENESALHALSVLALAEAAPDEVGRMLRRSVESHKTMQQTIDSIWLRVQQLERVSIDRATQIERQELRIAELKRGPAPPRDQSTPSERRSA